jgi:DNA polymerase-1
VHQARQAGSGEAVTKTLNYGAITKVDSLKMLIDKIGESEALYGFDIETGYEGPDRPNGAIPPHEDTFITGFSLTIDPTWARYVPLRHDLGPNLPEDKVWDIMAPLLKQRRMVAHNAKFEKRHVRKVGIDPAIAHDTMLEAYVLARWRTVGLKDMVKAEFKHEMARIESLFPDLAKKELASLRFNKLELTPEVIAYACEDAAWCLALHERIHPMVLAERAFIYKLELEIMNIMADVEDRGFSVDWSGISTAREKCEPFISHLAAEIRDDLESMLGRSMAKLNLGSVKQLQEVLFADRPEGLGLKPAKLTPKGAPSTDVTSMTKLAKDNGTVKKILEMREIENLRKRLKSWDEDVSTALDKKAHASYGQTVVPTGRFNASDPAIQQLPKDWRWALKGPWGDLFDKEVWAQVLTTLSPDEYFYGNFRDFLVASPGHYLLGYDYSQIELRAMAGLSQERTLLDAFNEGKDVHSITAAMMLGKRVEDLLKHERAIGKTMNFALLYGMGERSLGDRLGLSYEEAKRLYAAYFDGFASITSWMERVRRNSKRGKNAGFVETYFGRRITIWEYLESDRRMYSKGERIAVNAPVQGWAADYMKIAMCRAVRKLTEIGWYGTKVWLIANLHDALTFEVSNELNPVEVMGVIKSVVEFPVENFPKIETDWEFSQHWGHGYELAADTPVVFKDEQWTVEGQEPQPKSLPELEEQVEMPTEPTVDLEVEDKGRVFVLEVPEMPTERELQTFFDLLASKPGDNIIHLKTPQGTLALEQLATTLSISDAPRLELTLKGAKVFQPAAHVDTEALALELSL